MQEMFAGCLLALIGLALFFFTGTIFRFTEGWKYKNQKGKREMSDGYRMVMKILGIVMVTVGIAVFGMGIQSKSKENVEVEQNAFTAQVMEIGDQSIFVEPDEGTWARKSSDKIQVGISKADNQSKKTFEGIQTGDHIRIVITGTIAESYPAQASAVKIEILAK